MEYIASVSYGKDSLAMLEVIKQNNLPLDRAVHIEIMATPTIHADLPPMVEFKAKADKIIKEKYGIEIEHISAPMSYEEYFYAIRKRGNNIGVIYGFPMVRGAWCNTRLKISMLNQFANKKKYTQYVGIAADEPERLARLETKNCIAPLAEYGWTEQMAREWCEKNGLLSPIYTDMARGGCWFCHNQSLNQLRLLRKNYPEYWEKMLQWDKDSPVSFRPDKRGVADFEKRFKQEDEGLVPIDNTFKWRMLDEPTQLKFY